MGPLAAVVAACFSCWLLAGCLWCSVNYKEKLTSATKREWNEEPGPIRHNVAKMHHCGNCEEDAECPSCRSARVVFVKVEVCFASWKQCGIQHDELSVDCGLQGKKEN